MSRPEFETRGKPLEMLEDIEGERQPLDIAKELFTATEKMTKSDISPQQVSSIARGLWFAEKYGVPELPVVIDNILLLNRSKKGRFAKMFQKALENMKPTFTQKEGGGVIA